MDSLLCDEVWPSSPNAGSTNDHFGYCGSPMYAAKEDYEQAIAICLDKEMAFMPESNYVENLCSNNLVIARFKSIQWFIKSRIRLNLSLGTVFYAANYLDRFISMNHCNGWKYWMVELLSVACLSIASKFNETCTPTLLQIQMEDRDHLFSPTTIQRMEMMVLKALGWRLASTTPYSYLELFTRTILDSVKPHHHHQDLISRVENLLLLAISDSKLLGFRPSMVTISALSCSLSKLQISTSSDAYLTCLTSPLSHDQKGELSKCQKMMEEQEQSVDDGMEKLILMGHGVFHFCPSSPTTVLLEERINNFYDFHVDFSLFKMRSAQNLMADDESSRRIDVNKRKREEEEED